MKMTVFRLIGRSDYARWADVQSLETWWESRSRKLAAMIPKGTRVIEFGAGLRPLERCLDVSCSYIASDLVDRAPGTLVCDLNRRPLPDLGSLHPDVAVFAGVLEYVRDVPDVVAWLSRHVRYCAASYAVTRPARLVPAIGAGVRRTYYGYMNAYTEADLVTIFRQGGFDCLRADDWNDQRLFLFAAEQPPETRP
jgi:hypothetical protein